MRPRRFRRGETRASSPPVDVRSGFNEAPAIPPGRARGRGVEWYPSITASMRPRRFRRGELARLPGRFAVHLSFNEAPAIPPGRASSGCSTAKARHDASMRPRRFRRGERPGSQGAELWHVSCRFASAAPGEPCPKRPTGRPSLRIVKERHVSQCVTAPRALPGNPRALECSQTGRQVRRRLARRL